MQRATPQQTQLSGPGDTITILRAGHTSPFLLCPETGQYWRYVGCQFGRTYYRYTGRVIRESGPASWRRRWASPSEVPEVATVHPSRPAAA